MEMVLVLTHLTGSEELDRQRAEEYCRYAAHKGKIPVSDYYQVWEPPFSYLRATLETVINSV